MENPCVILHKRIFNVPGIGVVTHPATRQWPGGPEEMPGSTQQCREYPVIDPYKVQAKFAMVCKN